MQPSPRSTDSTAWGPPACAPCWPRKPICTRLVSCKSANILSYSDALLVQKNDHGFDIVRSLSQSVRKALTPSAAGLAPQAPDVRLRRDPGSVDSAPGVRRPLSHYAFVLTNSAESKSTWRWRGPRTPCTLSRAPAARTSTSPR